MTELLKTPLFHQHELAGAKIVDFGGWALPVNYGSQIDEHHAVRKDCGMFDVSHMTVSEVRGDQTLEFLSYLLANDISKVSSQPGKALYSCMLNHDGGVIDDLIVYYLDDQHCRLVTNASTNQKDMAWIKQQSESYSVEFNELPELALIALQGPNALAICEQALDSGFAEIVKQLSRFQGAFHGQQFVGRTGYTGEDGVELILTAEHANSTWEKLIELGVQPCGLGARDTLRLESGMSLYGNDLDEDHTPIESGIAWSVANKDEREFIGKTVLQTAADQKLIGLILLDRGVLRGHQKVVLNDKEIGEITSGTFSPSLEKSIALARIDKQAKLAIGDQVQIAVRNKHLNAVIAPSPFVKNGQATS